jgi:hypothetical protein
MQINSISTHLAFSVFKVISIEDVTELANRVGEVHLTCKNQTECRKRMQEFVVSEQGGGSVSEEGNQDIHEGATDGGSDKNLSDGRDNVNQSHDVDDNDAELKLKSLKLPVERPYMPAMPFADLVRLGLLPNSVDGDKAEVVAEWRTF